MLTILPIMLTLCIVLIFRLINKKYKPPIFGVYQRRNKYFWFKYLAMYFYLRAKQLFVHVKRLLAVELGYSYDGTVHIHEHDVALEQKHPLGEYPLAVDGVQFNGMSKKGAVVVCSIARRQNQMCDAFLYLKVEGEDLLLTPDLPETRLQQTPAEEGTYSVKGMEIFNFIPMRTWKLSYKGEMRPRSSPEKTVNVVMDLTWSATWPVFNADTHISPRSVALDIACEQWSIDYFKQLRKFRQIHYEQMGFMEGSVYIDGKRHVVKMPCARDHSAAKVREWRNYHRYVYHFIYLENGDCMAVGSVSHPARVSHLTLGYVCRKPDQAVLPVKWCDFQLWQHAEHQRLPADYGFVFNAGGETYEVKVTLDDEASFYVGAMREAKFYERWSTVEVNGVKGWACVEWQFNNVAAVNDN